MSKTELEIIKELVKNLDEVKNFLINRDNDKILDTLNNDNEAKFMDDKGTVFTVSKNRINNAIFMGNFAIKAETQNLIEEKK